MGRNTKDTKVDINLLAEENTLKFSRIQASIKFKRDSNFYIQNLSQKIIFVNGRPLEKDKKRRLFHNSLIDVRVLKIFFSLKKLFFFFRFAMSTSYSKSIKRLDKRFSNLQPVQVSLMLKRSFPCLLPGTAVNCCSNLMRPQALTKSQRSQTFLMKSVLF